MALGFVISRFALFVQLLTLQSSRAINPSDQTLSAFLGSIFILVGGLSILLASIQHKRFIATLSISDFPRGYSKQFAVALSIIIGILGVLLAGYLWVAGT